MVRYSVIAAVLAFPAVALMASSAAAQQGGAGQARPVRGDSVTLVYEREVFTYTGMNRRDPFQPLTSDDAGPRFEELSLQGIIYSTGRGASVALLSADGRIFRVRVGDTVGNSRVVEIGPLRVVFAVEDFGNVRQEMLELKERGGANQ